MSINFTIDENSNPFEAVRELVANLDLVLTAISNKDPDSSNLTKQLSMELQNFCTKDPDAALCSVQLCHELPYTIWHPVHVALLCEVITKHLELIDADRLTVICAALTCNIGMVELQDLLYQQEAPLTDDQKDAIHHHCQNGVGILRETGIDDQLWLDIVFQHHEKDDGTGYPTGIFGNEIIKEAKIVALADRYSAMISPRSYRQGMLTKDALRSVFLNKGEEHDEELAIIFIKELGIYPPGAFVKLANSETAIVIRRGKESTSPIVYSLLGPRGEIYDEPIKRDSSLEDFTISEVCPTDRSLVNNVYMLWNQQ